MQKVEEVAKVLDMDWVRLERESFKTFLEKELRNIEAEIHKIAAKHGIKSIFELDEKLKKGEISEEEVIDDFMEFDYFEPQRENFLKALEKIQW